MALWRSVQISYKKYRDEINIKELILLLQSIEEEGNIEIIKLTIQSMLDELSEFNDKVEDK